MISNDVPKLEINDSYITVTKGFIVAKGSGLDMMLLVSRILEEVTKGIGPEVFCDIVLGYLKHKDTME